jgi:hypothetical protein
LRERKPASVVFLVLKNASNAVWPLVKKGFHKRRRFNTSPRQRTPTGRLLVFDRCNPRRGAKHSLDAFWSRVRVDRCRTFHTIDGITRRQRANHCQREHGTDHSETRNSPSVTHLRTYLDRAPARSILKEASDRFALHISADRMAAGRNRLGPFRGDPWASGRHLAVALGKYSRNYVEFSRAKARENRDRILTTPHFKEVPIRQNMGTSPYLAERGLI